MTVKLARSNSLSLNRPLTDDEIATHCPSIFAITPHQSRSAERYRFISTSRVLEALRREGFEPFMVAQSNPRDEGRHGHAKHIIRLRRVDQENLNGEYPEVIYVGSHDGTSSSHLYGGYFRLVCTNGLVCGHDIGEIRVPHLGPRVVTLILEGAHKISHHLVKMDDHRARMKEIDLTKDEKGNFAMEALQIRYPGDKTPPIEPEQLLIPHNPIDQGNTLWLTFNVCQQNLTQGGLQGWSENRRRMTTRPIKAIGPSIEVNRKLWDLAESYMKQAA